MPTLSPQMAELERTVAAIVAQAALLSDLSETEWNWKAAPSDWSAVQILWHLNKSSEPLLPQFEAAIGRIKQSGTAAIGDAPFPLTLPEKMFIKVVSPECKFTPPAPPMLTPPESGLDPQGELRTFIQLHQGLLACIRNGSGLDLSRERIHSPISALFRPSVGAYLCGLVQHLRYHWLQVENRLRGSGCRALEY
jgi:DinB superfamily